MVWALLDGVLPQGSPEVIPSEGRSRGLAPPTAAFAVGFSGVVFSAVLIGQSVGWHRL